MEQSINELTIRNYLWLNSGLKLLYLAPKNKNKDRKKKSGAAQLKNYGVPPYKFVITYCSLHEDIDLFSKTQNSRIKLFKDILRNLNWQSGYVFIPFTQKLKNSVQQIPHLFWAKVDELKQKYRITHIFIFGRHAQKILIPSISSSSPYFVNKFKSYTILVLPSPEDMLPDNRIMKNIAWDILKRFKKTI